MTALNTTINHGQASHDFRRGLLVGAVATALLAASMAAAAFGAGVIGTAAPEAAAPIVQAPAGEAYPDVGLRNAPVVQAAPDYGEWAGPRMPAVQAPAPAVEPYTDFGRRNALPERINQSNPHQQGPIQAW